MRAILPIFPLGSVLLPGMPLALRVFEPRYLTMLERVLDGPGEFGVVLIERGSEVGGGDQPFGTGTVARVVSCEPDAGFVSVVAHGGPRFAVDRWWPDDPYPMADVRELPELEATDADAPLRADAEGAVRRALARASEFGDGFYPSDVRLSEDPVLAAWQLAGIAPIGPLDRLGLLGSESLGDLLRGVLAAVAGGPPGSEMWVR